MKSATKNLRRASGCAWGRRASITRNTQLAGSPAVASRPAEAARCLESHASTRTRVYHPQYARRGETLLRTQQAHANPRPMPACGRVVAARSRREPRSHAVDGLARTDATDRSHLHSRKDARTFARHAGLELRQEWRGIRSASPPFRRSQVCRVGAADSEGTPAPSAAPTRHAA